jgi:cystathionine gamma-synthase
MNIHLVKSSTATLLHAIALDALPTAPPTSPLDLQIRQHIAFLVYGENYDHNSLDHMTLTLSGMASIFTAFRIIQNSYHRQWSRSRDEQSRLRDPSMTRNRDNCSTTIPAPISMHTVVFGFPYLDTLKMQQCAAWNDHVHFFGHGDARDLAALEALLAANILTTDLSCPYRNAIAAIFTEFPSNPLLQCPDLCELTRLCTSYGVLLVIDDTIASYYNVNLLDAAQGLQIAMLCSSLTKCYSGVGNVMLGALVINPSLSGTSRMLRDTLARMVATQDLPWLSGDDLAVLASNASDYPARCHAMNTHALDLAIYLSTHPDVATVYYPGLSSHQGHHLYKRHKRVYGGYGCLLTIAFRDTINAFVFYDKLRLNKGPSLGTNFTLVCPYTLLAHYQERDWASGYGVGEELIRVSVGLEDSQVS